MLAAGATTWLGLWCLAGRPEGAAHAAVPGPLQEGAHSLQAALRAGLGRGAGMEGLGPSAVGGVYPELGARTPTVASQAGTVAARVAEGHAAAGIPVVQEIETGGLPNSSKLLHAGDGSSSAAVPATLSNVRAGGGVAAAERARAALGAAAQAPSGAGILGGRAAGTVADFGLPSSTTTIRQTNATDVPRALLRARQWGSRYLRYYEEAVSRGWAQELMAEPFGDGAIGFHGMDLTAMALRPGMQRWIPNDAGVPSTDELESWQPFARLADEAEDIVTGAAKDGGGCTFRPGTDIIGGDMEVVQGLSVERCCEICIKKKGCEAAVLSSLQDSPPRACWLKAGVRRFAAKDGVVACLRLKQRKNAGPGVKLGSEALPL